MNAPLDDRGLPQGYVYRPEWETTPREFRAMREAGEEVVLLDCRTPREYAIASIDGAELVPMQEIVERLPDLRQRLAGRKLLVHCHHGSRSLRVTAFLREQGWTDATSMAGGIDLWSMDIDPRVARY